MISDKIKSLIKSSILEDQILGLSLIDEDEETLEYIKSNLKCTDFNNGLYIFYIIKLNISIWTYFTSEADVEIGEASPHFGISKIPI